MSKKLLSVTVKGNEKTWVFDFYADPKYLEEWREDGLEVNEILNEIPLWVADRGIIAIRAWTFIQDVFNFKNPFK